MFVCHVRRRREKHVACPSWSLASLGLSQLLDQRLGPGPGVDSHLLLNGKPHLTVGLFLCYPACLHLLSLSCVGPLLASLWAFGPTPRQHASKHKELNPNAGLDSLDWTSGVPGAWAWECMSDFGCEPDSFAGPDQTDSDCAAVAHRLLPLGWAPGPRPGPGHGSQESRGPWGPRESRAIAHKL